MKSIAQSAERMAPDKIQASPGVSDPTTPQPSPGRGVLIAGWICFVLGLALMAAIVLVPVAGLFFLAAIALGIAAIVKRRVVAGLVLMGSAMVVPLLIAGILALGFVGVHHTQTVPATVTASVGPPPAGADRATGEVPALELATVLSELDACGGDYRAASTSAQKEEVRQQTRAKAQTLIQGRQMALRTTIKDVRISSEGAVTLLLNDWDTGGYGQGAQKELRVGFTGKLAVSLSRDEALKIPAGAAIELTGTPVFRTARGSVVLDGMSRAADLVILGFAGDIKDLGSLRLEPYRLRVADGT